MAIATETFSKKLASAFLKAVDPTDNEGLEKIHQELKSLSLVAKEPLNGFFLNPVFHHNEKQAVLDEVFSKHKLSDYTKRFVETLLSLDQLSLMETLAEDFAFEVREKNQEAKIGVVSAYPLSEKEKEKIRELFEKAVGKKVLLDITVDRELIGGIRANIGGVVYDSSIQGHLMRLQKEFLI